MSSLVNQAHMHFRTSESYARHGVDKKTAAVEKTRKAKQAKVNKAYDKFAEAAADGPDAVNRLYSQVYGSFSVLTLLLTYGPFFVSVLKWFLSKYTKDSVEAIALEAQAHVAKNL